MTEQFHTELESTIVLLFFVFTLKHMRSFAFHGHFHLKFNCSQRAVCDEMGRKKEKDSTKRDKKHFTAGQQQLRHLMNEFSLRLY